MATLSNVGLVRELLAPHIGARQLHFVPCSPERLERYLARLNDASQPQMLLEHLESHGG